MNMGKIVMDILRELTNREKIKLTDSLIDDLGMDSLEMVMLLVCLEDQLEIHLKESDMNPYDLQTVNDVIALAERYEGGSTNAQ